MLTGVVSGSLKSIAERRFFYSYLQLVKKVAHCDPPFYRFHTSDFLFSILYSDSHRIKEFVVIYAYQICQGYLPQFIRICQSNSVYNSHKTGLGYKSQGGLSFKPPNPYLINHFGPYPA